VPDVLLKKIPAAMSIEDIGIKLANSYGFFQNEDVGSKLEKAKKFL